MTTDVSRRLQFVKAKVALFMRVGFRSIGPIRNGPGEDDEWRILTENAPETFVTLKPIAVNLTRITKARDFIPLALKTDAREDISPNSTPFNFLQPFPPWTGMGETALAAPDPRR